MRRDLMKTDDPTVQFDLQSALRENKLEALPHDRLTCDMGEGINFYIRDELWDPEKMRVHVDRYHPIGRMFADRYCRTDDRVIFPAAEGVRSA